MYACPECEQLINQATEICPYCHADLTSSLAGLAAPAAVKRRRVIRSVILGAIVILFLWVIAWFALPLRSLDSKTQAESRAREALSAVNSELLSYAAAQGNFPPSLEDLGRGARRAAQSALSGGYRLEYIPAQPAPDGRVHAYSLLARPSNYGFQNFYSDETGIIRATQEDRAATPQDLAIPR